MLEEGQSPADKNKEYDDKVAKAVAEKEKLKENSMEKQVDIIEKI